MSADVSLHPDVGGDPDPVEEDRAAGVGARLVRTVLTQRIALLGVLIVLVLVWFSSLSAGGYLTASYDGSYIASSLIDAVPLAMLALAELVVIVSGRGGIDLSVGSTVSLAGMVFGFAYGQWHWPLVPAILLTVLAGGVLGGVNGVLIARLRFPALIATLATYYAYQSIAVVINHQQPISSAKIQALYSITSGVYLPLVGGFVPAIPLGVFTFLLPTVVVLWLLIARTAYGRRLFAIGTNDVAAAWSGIPVPPTRARAYVLAGVIAGLVSVYLTAQFASARPDAGTSGSGLALPAITIAVLGGVAITGGVGRVAGVVLAALLITWIDSGILLYFVGNDGTQYQLAALGIVLVFAALLNSATSRRYGGER